MNNCRRELCNCASLSGPCSRPQRTCRLRTPSHFSRLAIASVTRRSCIVIATCVSSTAKVAYPICNVRLETRFVVKCNCSRRNCTFDKKNTNVRLSFTLTDHSHNLGGYKGFAVRRRTQGFQNSHFDESLHVATRAVILFDAKSSLGMGNCYKG